MLAYMCYKRFHYFPLVLSMKSGHGNKMAANDNWPNAIKQSCAEGKTHVVDHEVHDGLGHEVADRLVDDGHVGVHQVADRLHLPLQLGVHGEVLRGGGALTLHLDKPTAFRRSNGALGNPNGKLGLKLEIKKFEIETFNTINPNINIGIGKFQ